MMAWAAVCFPAVETGSVGPQGPLSVVVESTGGEQRHLAHHPEPYPPPAPGALQHLPEPSERLPTASRVCRPRWAHGPPHPGGLRRGVWGSEIAHRAVAKEGDALAAASPGLQEPARGTRLPPPSPQSPTVLTAPGASSSAARASLHVGALEDQTQSRTDSSSGHQVAAPDTRPAGDPKDFCVRYLPRATLLACDRARDRSELTATKRPTGRESTPAA